MPGSVFRASCTAFPSQLLVVHGFNYQLVALKCTLGRRRDLIVDIRDVRTPWRHAA